MGLWGLRDFSGLHCFSHEWETEGRLDVARGAKEQAGFVSHLPSPSPIMPASFLVFIPHLFCLRRKLNNVELGGFRRHGKKRKSKSERIAL
jgi:hypothetical protein